MNQDVHQRLMEQYTELASLAGGLAHEIKNRLSTLNLNLQLLAEDFQDAESQTDRRAGQKLDLLQREVRRLESILNDFLRFARVHDLEFELCDLNQVVRDTLTSFGPTAQQGKILIREDLRPSLPPLRLDKDFLEQALLNLLLNARNAMPNGGELIVKTRSDDKWVYLDIIDTGDGMSRETLAKVFKPFYSARKGGSGLGLPTARKIIEAHHGELHLESELGKGTACTIKLPVPEE